MYFVTSGMFGMLEGRAVAMASAVAAAFCTPEKGMLVRPHARLAATKIDTKAILEICDMVLSFVDRRRMLFRP
jgi:hypothetical protein